MGTDISHLKGLYRNPNPGNFPDVLDVRLRKECDAKYGENPHQRGAIYCADEIGGVNARRIAELTNVLYVRSDGKGKGGLSLTNIMDVTRAMDVLKYFAGAPACVIMKHTIVSGFARGVEGKSCADLFTTARDCDARSNYGGTAVFTRALDRAGAEALFSGPFVDVLAAPDYETGVVGFIEGKSKNMRIAQFSALHALPKFRGDDSLGLLSIKEMPTGRFAVQDIYLTSIRTGKDFIVDPKISDERGVHTVQRAPNNQELEDLVTAWHLNIAGARSNGIVFVRDGVLVSCGSGQVERVGAVEQAVVKGMQKAMDRERISYEPLFGMVGCDALVDNPFKGAACASDGFFPFPDSLYPMKRVGVTAVAHPYGSMRDAEIIDATNACEMAGVCTSERGFTHF